MTTFLTVKEASLRTGKSSSSIRRIIYPIIRDDAHTDRAHVEPTIDEVRALRMKGENFAWRVSEELLRREIPTETRHETASHAGAKPASGDHGELLAMLRRELDIKNEQIGKQGELIAKQLELVSGLSERLREGNVLIGLLQQRLALTDGRQEKAPDAMKVNPGNTSAAKKGSNMPAKPTKKRGLFSRLFR